ncbi:hypothetical protein BC628DRAFT_1385050 [Trametes gibbosa]|nr:hypothetical protein BC628DRAFT_1385050 [Trametes gibbosa]UVI59156.1 Zn(2)-Cys(6)58 [Trametes gibbosa]
MSETDMASPPTNVRGMSTSSEDVPSKDSTTVFDGRSSVSNSATSLPQDNVNTASPTTTRNERGRSDPARDDPSSSSCCSETSRIRTAKKLRIDLAPDQPPTADGKPRARVYVACYGCRIRKVRCDGAKPVCYNCRRRDPTIQTCNYDGAPRRRGQDKVPGTRVRSAPGKRKSRPPRIDSDSSQDDRQETHCLQEMIDTFDPSSFDPTQSNSYILPDPPSHEETEEQEEEATETLSSEPGVQFTRETWWDSLLVLYALEDDHGVVATALTANQRSASTRHIFKDIRSLFRTSVYWGSFVHLPRFFEALLDPARRSSIQPGLILAMLAVGIFVQSSDLRLGSSGRTRALKFIDQAHAAIQASLSTHWVDIGLVQAAWILAFFEMQAHPQQSWERNRSAFLLLDSLIRLFSLTTLDADLPNSQFSLFAMQNAAATPALVPLRLPNPGAQTTGLQRADLLPEASLCPPVHTLPGTINAGCSCARFTLKQQWPAVLEVAPLWQATAMWPTCATEGEIRREECRRLVWSSVMLTAGHNSYASASAEVDHADLYIKHYDNYVLLLPGEALARSGAPVEQNDIWALFLRAMILWHTGIRMRTERLMPDLQRAQFAIDAWLEADAVEAALNLHTCDLESRLAYQAREFLFNARMCISSDFQRYLPHVSSDRSSLLYREKCESWLRGQMAVTESLWNCLHTNPANELGTRSFLVYWFMGHITRALVLWENDRTLTLALDAAKVFVLPLEYLMRLWPCARQRETWQRLRYRLVEACLKAGITPPAPTLPPPPPRTGLCAPDNE